jgi:hypothetical protein
VPTGVHDRVAALTSLQVRLLGWAALVAFVALRWARLGSLGAFPLAGGSNVHAGTPAGLRVSGTGYDGQYVYRLALDPFTRAVTAHGITLDLPGYRQQRIMTALLAYLVAKLPGVSVFAALVVVNVVAVAVAIWFGTALAAQVGRHPALGLVLAVPACMPISVGRDLTEPVAWAGALAGIYLVRQRRWFWAGVALTVAVLARETTGVVAAGLIVGQAWALGRRWPSATRQAAWLLLPVVVEAGWQLWLAHVWGTLPLRTGQSSQHLSGPVVGVLGSLLFGLVGHHSGSLAFGLAVFVERVVLLGLILAAAWSLIRRRSRAMPGEIVGWALAVVLALSLSAWQTDVSFLRATYEAWAMSVLLLVLARSPASRYPLAAAGVVTLGVASMYVHLV